MNVHFLELFYYVARHGGISAAVRQIPYGIQQPAVSTQVGKLEQELGVKLFERSPFRLTKAGELLYAYVGPFFDQMPDVTAKLRAADETELRVGGAEIILRDHLPVIITEVRKKFPRLRYSLRALGYQSEVENWLRQSKLDIAFLPLGARPPAKLQQLPMAKLPLVLQVHPKSKYKKAEELLSEKSLSLPLISLPDDSSISRAFQAELKRRGIRWPQTVEAASLDIVQRYVANGDGIGVNLRIDAKKKPRDVRLVELPDFRPVTLGALWSGKLSAVARATIDSVYAYARRTWPEAVV